MTHGRDCPKRCSLCLGVPARRVQQRDDVLVIDGVEVRAIAPPVGAGLKQARGGRNTGRITKPRRAK